MSSRPTRCLGKEGEDWVVRHMVEALGLRLIDRNVRIGKFELDIIAHSDDSIVFCEVRTRRSTLSGHPIETFDRAKLARTRRCAALWLQTSKPSELRRLSKVRFDVAALVWADAPELVYLENAF